MSAIDLKPRSARRAKLVEGCVTFPVSGSAYDRLGRAGAGRDTSKAMLTHSWHRATDKTICRKVKPESVCEDYALPGQDDPPTCPECLRRDARFALPE